MTIKSKAAQDFVPIKEIRDNVVILKDGTDAYASHGIIGKSRPQIQRRTNGYPYAIPKFFKFALNSRLKFLSSHAG